jgi:hypothetical protein
MTNPLLGTWKLQSFTTEDPDTGEQIEPYGAHPSGYLSYSADRRMYVIIVGEGREPPTGVVPTGAEMVALFSGMAAYAGSYTIQGDEVHHHVDVSWIEAWTGTTQVRRFRIEGSALHIRSVAAPDPADGRISSSTLVWTKVPSQG